MKLKCNKCNKEIEVFKYSSRDIIECDEKGCDGLMKFHSSKLEGFCTTINGQPKYREIPPDYWDNNDDV